ncbi:hypothetical protein B0H63DRAFT_404760, partial [Podospora didyma]
FCYNDYSHANDTLLLSDYLAHENETVNFTATVKDGQQTSVVPCVLYLAPAAEPAPEPVAKAATSASILSKGNPFAMKVYEWAEAGVTSRGAVQSSSLGAPDPSKLTMAGLRKLLGSGTKMSMSQSKHKFCTASGMPAVDESMTFAAYLQLEETEADEQSELPSVSVFYKLDKPRSEPQTHQVDMTQMPGKLTKEDYALTGQEFVNSKMADTFQEKQRISQIEDQTFRNGAASNPYAVDAGYLTEGEWTEVVRNCGIMYGWIIDRENNRIVRAPKPAFRLRSKPVPEEEDPTPMVADTEPSQAEESTQVLSPLASAQLRAQELRKKVGNWKDAGRLTGGMLTLPRGADLKSETAKALQQPVIQINYNTPAPPPKAEAPPPEPEAPSNYWTATQFMRRATYEGNTVMPSFQVNDDSRVEVIVSSHEFETSMARNDFSGSSTEGSMSGGYGGFAVSVSAGKEAQNRHFGQLWCQRVTIGGRLQSTKIMSDTTATKEQQQKESFKWSVGAQVTTPWVSGGVKHSKTGGTDNQDNEADVKRREENVFEAVGGDTILVTNPEMWAATVADFRTWRRCSLSPLVDALSAIKGYAAVRSWFIQAMPTLSRYIELPPSKEVSLRFKVNTPTTQLSLSYLKQGTPEQRLSDPIYYFGHTKDSMVRPVENSVNMRVNFWSQMDMEAAKPLFSPQSYRAPVLLGYPGNKVGDSAFGTEFSQEYTNTLWSVSAPFNDALQHEARVCIQTVPLPDQNLGPTDAASAFNETVLSLAVFRNQQGVFLPGLTDAAERQFWRIMKVGGTSPDEHIKEGDEIYFCWLFSDQTTGFRDFVDDVFGRRRHHIPQELTSKTLFLKLPWPRFEGLQPTGPGKTNPPAPNTMVLSTEVPTFDGVPKLVSFKTLPSISRALENAKVGSLAQHDETVFAVQDVTFRADLVGNGGRGESGDELLKGLKQETSEKEKDKPVDVGLLAARARSAALYAIFEGLLLLSK